ncbi:uncharacterized protein BJ212DRAFT_1482498 [Suillus subaureus]|uniref:Uncharacterized protein n=1 Tax=Suillus subaureus TaxID=48587 RepID=A0A9P7E7P8_9AGAM|nr:uncharacterized protein BJ212DRAFT_1482498 [Suillus subaureus]KAG1813595.1 hypothetical protein BJ212DRAFT_1482498 [Suillus subaureus]
MPRKAAATAAPADDSVPTGTTTAAVDGDANPARRSSRLAGRDKPAPKKAPAKPRGRKPKPTADSDNQEVEAEAKPKSARGKKRTVAEKAAEEGAQPESEEAPAAKKAKPESKAASKPASKATSKPASPAAPTKPASKATKPASRASAKPLSTTAKKPASRAASKKPASRAEAPTNENEAPGPADKTIVEEPEEEAAASAEAPVMETDNINMFLGLITLFCNHPSSWMFPAISAADKCIFSLSLSAITDLYPCLSSPNIDLVPSPYCS